MHLPNLPTGTLTFLFTDIEGSTQLWEGYPNQARAALARHDQIIEEIVAQHGGTVVRPRGEGDSRFAVFSRATDAVVASADVQRALFAEAWPSPISLRVRMALHTGEADLREGDYYGSDVNRCARLRAVAHGSQTLVSAATHALVRDSLPEGITLRDLGEHRLKDLQRPERIFQVVAPGFPTDFPPLRSLGNIPNNLPTQLTSFVGREREIEEAKRLLLPESGDLAQPQHTTRLLTLAGAGGTGKTRLALQVAAELLDSYPDGVWFAELAPVADHALVPQAVASSVGAREAVDSSPVENLINHLRHKTTLLLLDNCEHLIEECATLVEALLQTCPHLSVLATTREPLGIAGELPYRVPSLSLPDPRHLPGLDALSQYEAVILFVERARMAQGTHSFVLTEQNASSIAEICRRLDGIPLAIELAAARARILTVDQIATRLDDQFRLLTGGSRTAMPRQQTLRAAIDWSYDLLPGEERALLRRLSVFMGGWSLEAAELVCASDGIEAGDVLDLLSHLADKSLVVVEPQLTSNPEGRYRLLETIRQYARDKLLEAGEAALIRDKHLTFFLKMMEALEPKLLGPSAKASFDCVDAEYDNIRAALEWSLSGDEGKDAQKVLRLAGPLRKFWFFRGPLTEGRQWLERAIALPGSATQDDDPSQLAARGKALQGAGQIAWQQADTQSGRVWLEESISIQRRLGEPARADLAQSLHLLGHVAFDQLEYDQARALFEESLAIFREVGDKVIGPALLGDLGVIAHNIGDYPTARRLLEQSLSEYRGSNALHGEAQMLSKLGDLSRSEGDYDAAAKLYETSLSEARELDSSYLKAIALHRLGQVAYHRGNYTKANSLLQESLRMNREAGNKQGIAECLAALAGLAQVPDQAAKSRQENARWAARLFGAADALLGRTKVPLTPADRTQHDTDLAAARSQLDEQAWETAWVEGQAISIEQAIAYALEETAASEGR